jgi:NAD(P)-dependent dehydrogenase (short-subunit alcohol dehydrogenase family)
MEYDARKAMTGSIDLRGQVSVVTRGGRGPGQAVAQALAGAGSVIAVVARSAAEIAETVALIERAGGRARAFTADVTAMPTVWIGHLGKSSGRSARLAN